MPRENSGPERQEVQGGRDGKDFKMTPGEMEDIETAPARANRLGDIASASQWPRRDETAEESSEDSARRDRRETRERREGREGREVGEVGEEREWGTRSPRHTIIDEEGARDRPWGWGSDEE